MSKVFSSFDDSMNPGVLLLVDSDPTHRCKCTLWFDFTMKSVQKIKEGDLVAIKNFESNSTKTHYSIFRLTEVMPKHFAIDENDLKAYPGNLEETAKSITTDYTEQENESTEDLTKIFCRAFPVNLQFIDADDPSKIQPFEDETLPITGSSVYKISDTLSEIVYNHGISADGSFEIGSLIRNRNVSVLVNTEDLLKVHFAIFGFTGAGKSNLVSTTISTILSKENLKTKFVLFDITDEYTGLLVDQLLNPSVNGLLVALGKENLPRQVFNYLSNSSSDSQQLASAVDSFVEGMLLPKSLKPKREEFKPFIQELLETRKIKIIDMTYTRTVKEYAEEIWSDIFTEYIKGTTEADISEKITPIFKTGQLSEQQLTPNIATQIRQRLEAQKYPDAKPKTKQETVNSSLESIQKMLNVDILLPAEDPIPERLAYSVDELILELNNESSKSLIIMISDSADDMRKLSAKIGNYIYSHRRNRALTSPIVSFVFDEADEFIPSGATGTKFLSKELVERLSRRGRKFGLGIGLATQRISYLDTNIMGQPHTYFISKLPRDYDRKTIGEAFGLSEEDLKETLRFKKGEWMLVSHDATGLEGQPIPIKADNAEERILNFLRDNSPNRQTTD